jgi:hypothetical protein
MITGISYSGINMFLLHNKVKFIIITLKNEDMRREVLAIETKRFKLKN